MVNLSKIFSFILAFLALSLSFAQISFYKTYTGGLYDVGQGVCELPDSSYAITGSTSSLSETTSKTLLMVVDSLGNHLWTKGYGGNESDWGRRIFHRENQGFWIMGYSNSYGDGSFDFTIWRINDQGELLWVKNLENSAWSRLWDAIELPNGDFILAGEIEGDETLAKDILLYRITEEGDEVWEKHIENSGDDIAYAVALYDDTTLLVAGEYFENEQRNGIILNIHTADGSINNHWIYDEDGEASFRDIAIFVEDIYIAGAFFPDSIDNKKSIQLKIDVDFNIESDNFTSWSGDLYFSNVAVKTGNAIYWVMHTESPDHNVFPGGKDALLLRYNNALQWAGVSLPLTGYDPDEVHQIIPTQDGGLLLVGLCSDDRTQSSQGRDVMLYKIGPNDEFTGDATVGNDLVNIYEEETSVLKVFPNPFSEDIKIETNENITSMEVYDLLGKRIPITVKESTIINFSKSLPKGTYFLKINLANSYQVRKVIKE